MPDEHTPLPCPLCSTTMKLLNSGHDFCIGCRVAVSPDGDVRYLQGSNPPAGAPRRIDRGTGTPTAEATADANELQELGYWVQRAAFLEHLYREAVVKVAEMQKQCEAAGISSGEIQRAVPRLGTAGKAAAAGGGGGFAFFYAESGVDADLDGDVDGGLVDSIGDLFG